MKTKKIEGEEYELEDVADVLDGERWQMGEEEE